MVLGNQHTDSTKEGTEVKKTTEKRCRNHSRVLYSSMFSNSINHYPFRIKLIYGFSINIFI